MPFFQANENAVPNDEPMQKVPDAEKPSLENAPDSAEIPSCSTKPGTAMDADN